LKAKSHLACVGLSLRVFQHVPLFPLEPTLRSSHCQSGPYPLVLENSLPLSFPVDQHPLSFLAFSRGPLSPVGRLLYSLFYRAPGGRVFFGLFHGFLFPLGFLLPAIIRMRLAPPSHWHRRRPSLNWRCTTMGRFFFPAGFGPGATSYRVIFEDPQDNTLPPATFAVAHCQRQF